MPKLGEEFEQAEEAKAYEYKSMEPGAYMCKVQQVLTEGTLSGGRTWTSDEKQYVMLLLDVDEGEHAGKFGDTYWEGKEYAHRLYMSWKPSAMGMLKHTFAAFEDANAGFDARAAFEADRWELFAGKRLLVLWNGQEYESNTGELRMSVRPDRALTAEDKPRPKVEKLDGEKVDYADWKAQQDGASTSPAPAADPYADSVPF